MKPKRVAIYDMDGTIVCSMHRYRAVDGKIDLAHWRANEHRAYDDSLLPMSEQYRADMRDENCFVVIATARHMQRPDWDFVHDYLGMPDLFISRNGPDDSRKGGELKIQGLQPLADAGFFHNRDVVFYEDNITYLKTVCDHFNIRGVYIPSQQGH